MTTMEVPSITKAVQEANAWVNRLARALEVNDAHAAYVLLRATLHAIRDRIGPANAVHFGAQLPTLLRGVYYEGWKMATPPSRERDATAFVDHVLAEVPATLFKDPRAAICTTLAVIRTMIDPGEALKLIHLFPRELRDSWLAVQLA